MGKLKIKVKPGANKNKIVKMAEGRFKVWVKKSPVKGKANKELIHYLKNITGVPVRIVAGKTSKYKLIEFNTSKEEFISKLEKE